MSFMQFYDIKDPKTTSIIETQLMKYLDENSFWSSMTGSSDRHPIKSGQFHMQGEIKRKFLNQLTGEGVRGNANFDTNEDELTRLSMSIMQDIYGNSVRSEDLRIEQYIKGNQFSSEAVQSLADWDRRMFDSAIFANLTHNCTNVAAFSKANPTGLYTLDDTAKTTSDLCANIEETDTFNLKSLRRALYRARQGIDQYNKEHPEIRPYRVNTMNKEGINIVQNVFIAILHPAQIAALEDDPEYQALQRGANVRGIENPLISGQVGSIQGCIICDGGRWSDKNKQSGVITSDCDAGRFREFLNSREIVDRGIHPPSIYAGKNNTRTAVGLLIGGAAMLLVSNFATKVSIEHEDHGRKLSIAMDRFYGMRKTHFTGHTPEEKASFYHGKDFSMMALISAIE